MSKMYKETPFYRATLAASDTKFKDGTPLGNALQDTKRHITRAFSEQPKVTVKVSTKAFVNVASKRPD